MLAGNGLLLYSLRTKLQSVLSSVESLEYRAISRVIARKMRLNSLDEVSQSFSHISVPIEEIKHERRNEGGTAHCFPKYLLLSEGSPEEAKVLNISHVSRIHANQLSEAELFGSEGRFVLIHSGRLLGTLLYKQVEHVSFKALGSLIRLIVGRVEPTKEEILLVLVEANNVANIALFRVNDLNSFGLRATHLEKTAIESGLHQVGSECSFFGIQSCSLRVGVTLPSEVA